MEYSSAWPTLACTPLSLLSEDAHSARTPAFLSVRRESINAGMISGKTAGSNWRSSSAASARRDSSGLPLRRAINSGTRSWAGFGLEGLEKNPLPACVAQQICMTTMVARRGLSEFIGPDSQSWECPKPWGVGNPIGGIDHGRAISVGKLVLRPGRWASHATLGLNNRHNRTCRQSGFMFPTRGFTVGHGRVASLHANS